MNGHAAGGIEQFSLLIKTSATSNFSFHLNNNNAGGVDQPSLRASETSTFSQPQSAFLTITVVMQETSTSLDYDQLLLVSGKALF